MYNIFSYNTYTYKYINILNYKYLYVPISFKIERFMEPK